MPRASRRLTLVFLLALASACASGGHAGAASRTSPPRLRQTTDYPALVGSRPSEMEYRVDIRVMVDPNGRADISTLQMTGNALSDNRNAITEWLARSMFEPATTDGLPVRGEFRMTLKTKVSVQRR